MDADMELIKQLMQKSIYKNIIILFVMVVFSSCLSDKERLSQQISEMKKSQIDLCLDDMELVRPDSTSNAFPDQKYNIIVYSDTTDCSKCYINHLYMWNDLLYLESKYHVSFVFIIESGGNENLSLLKSLLQQSRLRHSIYIDNKYAFRTKNPKIPRNTLLHVFLTDESNKVLIVGNPLNNTEIKEMMINILSNKAVK